MRKNDYKLIFYLRLYILAMLFLGFGHYKNIILANNNDIVYLPFPSYDPNPVAEKWILEQVAAGKIANLKERFPEESDRIISANFIENLLTNSINEMKVTRRGIQIQHAILFEPIDLENAEIPHEIRLNNCRFENSVNFSKSHFHEWAYFEDSTLKDANFNSIKVNGSIIFRKSVFEGSLDLQNSYIDNDLNVDNAQFCKTVNTVNFYGIQVGNDAFFHGVVFAGFVNFESANIGRHFVAPKAQFNNVEKGATFYGMKVGDSANFTDVVSNGPMNFGCVNVGCQFTAENAQFKNSEKEANFNGIKVGGGVFFDKVVFAGSVNLGSADICKQLIANEAQFKSPDKEANFNSMRVGNAAFFNKAVFAGPVNFGFVDCGGNFEADGVQFKNPDPDKEVNFNGMKVGGEASFNKLVSQARICMRNANFFNLLIQGDKENPPILHRLDISRTVIRRKLQIHNLKLSELFATSLHVEDSASLNSLTIHNEAMFEHSSFQTIILFNILWPANSKSFRLNGMTYEYISTEPEDKSFEILLDMVNKSTYSPDAYTNLETFFKQQGQKKLADNIYITMKQRERAEMLKWYSAGWWWNLFLDKFVQYGRKPGWAFYWIIPAVAFGCVIFWKGNGMESVKLEDNNRHYSPFWYSLGLFTPFIDLGPASVWQPTKERWFARNYAQVHKILGWLLIPIALAAITGIIK